LAQAAIESFAQHSSQDVMGHRVYERRVEQGPEGNTCVAAPCARRQPGFDLTTPCPESTARPPSNDANRQHRPPLRFFGQCSQFFSCKMVQISVFSSRNANSPMSPPEHSNCRKRTSIYCYESPEPCLYSGSIRRAGSSRAP
jgi:hypothetical protein